MIVRGYCLFDSTVFWDAQDAVFGVLNQERRVVCVKIVILLSTLVNHGFREHAEELHDELKLLLLVISGEERFSCVQLSQDTTERPHVDLL